MLTRLSHALRRHAHTLLLVGGLLPASIIAPTIAFAQTNVSTGIVMSDDMTTRLQKKGDITLRDTNFVEAMFALHRVWGVNIVTGNELKGETVSCEFVAAPLHEILDSILLPRGYGYKPVGNSLVIIKLDSLGDLKPRFESLTVPVHHADPLELERVATLYLSPHGKIQVIPSAKSIVVIDYPEQNARVKEKIEEIDATAKIVADAEEEKLRKAEAIALQNAGAAAGSAPGAGPALVPGSNNRVAFFDLQYVKAESIAPAIQPILNTLGRVSVMTRDNRLIVYDTEEKLQVIAEAIRQLDVPRPQVRISALIYDVSLDDIRRLGVNWGRTGGKGNNLGADGSAQDSVIFSALTAAAPNTNSSLTFTSLGSNFDLNMVVNALNTARDSRLLADPSVVIYDMETAKIDSVREIPYQQLTQSAQGGTIGTTAFREAGITLTVTPQVSCEETLNLTVNPKFSILAGLTPDTNQPIIDRREYTGVVRARNRETIVIGGMRQREFNRSRAGVPFLMNIRGIGELFKNKDATARESELVVFLTPEIIDLQYLGRAREHAIYNGAVAELDTIMHPRLPEHPCPLEDWKRRCGCQLKHCKGDCPRCRQYREACLRQESGAPAYSGPAQPGFETPPQFDMQNYPVQQGYETAPVQVRESTPQIILPPSGNLPAASAADPAWSPAPAPARVEEVPSTPYLPPARTPDARGVAPLDPLQTSRRDAARPIAATATGQNSAGQTGSSLSLTDARNARPTTNAKPPANPPQQPVVPSPVRTAPASNLRSSLERNGNSRDIQTVADQQFTLINPLRRSAVQRASAQPTEIQATDAPAVAEPRLLPTPVEASGPARSSITLTPRRIFVPLPPVQRESATEKPLAFTQR